MCQLQVKVSQSDWRVGGRDVVAAGHSVEVVHCAWSEPGLPKATPVQPDIGVGAGVERERAASDRVSVSRRSRCAVKVSG